MAEFFKMWSPELQNWEEKGSHTPNIWGGRECDSGPEKTHMLHLICIIRVVTGSKGEGWLMVNIFHEEMLKHVFCVFSEVDKQFSFCRVIKSICHNSKYHHSERGGQSNSFWFLKTELLLKWKKKQILVDNDLIFTCAPATTSKRSPSIRADRKSF